MIALMYHDMKSSLTTPKKQLMTDLKDAGYDDMVMKVVEGKYDF